MEKDKIEKDYSNIFVLVPAYNEASVIEETINSLKEYFNNIIVVNDGSSDNTVSILKNFDITIINHPINIIHTRQQPYL